MGLLTGGARFFSNRVAGRAIREPIDGTAPSLHRITAQLIDHIFRKHHQRDVDWTLFSKLDRPRNWQYSNVFENLNRFVERRQRGGLYISSAYGEHHPLLPSQANGTFESLSFSRLPPTLGSTGGSSCPGSTRPTVRRQCRLPSDRLLLPFPWPPPLPPPPPRLPPFLLFFVSSCEIGSGPGGIQRTVSRGSSTVQGQCARYSYWSLYGRNGTSSECNNNGNFFVKTVLNLLRRTHRSGAGLLVIKGVSKMYLVGVTGGKNHASQDIHTHTHTNIYNVS